MALGVLNSSILNDKTLRNAVEHIDERFEDHYATYGTGPHRDFNLVAAAPAGWTFPPASARGYIAGTSTVWIFGESRDLQAIARTLWDLADSFTVPITIGRSTSPAGTPSK